MTTESSTEVLTGVRRPVRLLLGREDDLAALESGASEVVDGSGLLIVVEGPAGIGKTSLLDESRKRVSRSGFHVLSARCGELEQTFGFGVVRQLLEGRVAGTTGDERKRLLAGAARLAEPVFATDSSDADHTAFATLHGLHWLVANIAEEKPLAMIIDDIQWCDEASLRFLLYLAKRRSDMPILIVLARRSADGPLHEHLQMLLLEADTLLRPCPLDMDAVGEFVRKNIGDVAQSEFIVACREATGGNPFFLSELMGEVRRGAVSARDSSAIAEVVPERVSVSVLHRVRSIGKDALSLARSIAVLGDQARLRTCSRVADLDFTTAHNLAQRLADVSVIEQSDPLRFTHPIIRTAIYSDLEPAERSRLHSLAAQKLTDEHAELGTIAIHVATADPAGSPGSVQMLRDAARKGMSEGAPDIAAKLLRRALDEPPPDSQNAVILLELGLAEHELGHPEATLHLLKASQAATDILVRAKALAAVTWTNHVDARFRADLLDDFARTAADVRPLDVELSLQLEAARLGTMIFNGPLAHRFPEEAGRYADLPARTAGECLLRSFVARRALILGKIQQAGDLAEQAIAHPDFETQSAHPLWRANITMCLVAAERFDLAEDALNRSVAKATQLGSAQWLFRALWLRGSIRNAKGDLHGAETDARSALAITQRGQDRTAATVLITSLALQGRLDEAQSVLVANHLDGALRPSMPTPVSLGARGRLRLAQGDWLRAKNDLARALEIREATGRMVPHLDWQIALIHALWKHGDHDEALSLAQRTVLEAEASGTRRAIGGSLHALGVIQGGGVGLQTLERAKTVLAESPSILFRAEALIDYGAALRRRGQSVIAREALREGMDLAGRCGARPLADLAAEELRAAGARVTRRSMRGVDSLTASEHRVAQLAADGLSNKDIAQTLFVALRTVEMHLSNAYSKLEIQTRQELSRALSAH